MNRLSGLVILPDLLLRLDAQTFDGVDRMGSDVVFSDNQCLVTMICSEKVSSYRGWYRCSTTYLVLAYLIGHLHTTHEVQSVGDLTRDKNCKIRTYYHFHTFIGGCK